MLIDVLRQRRSVRQFTTQPIEQQEIDVLLEAVIRSPSSRGLNPWQFIAVTDTGVIEALAKAKTHGSAFMQGAPLAIVVCGEPERSDVWVEDCSIAAAILHLTATDLGLGSCWVQIRLREHDDSSTAEEYVRQLLAIPENYAVEAIIACGYAAEEKPGHAKESLSYEKVHEEMFGH